MYDDLIKLVAVTETEKANGDLEQTFVKKEILADKKSVGMKEKYEALSKGLNPELVFEIADRLDYDGQEYIEYGTDGEGSPVRYRVLRTYGKNDSDELEIVVER